MHFTVNGVNIQHKEEIKSLLATFQTDGQYLEYIFFLIPKFDTKNQIVQNMVKTIQETILRRNTKGSKYKKTNSQHFYS